MIGIPLALLYTNAGEWAVHKYLLHAAGKRRKSFWSFHFYEHHQAARKHGGRDPNYERSVFGLHAQGKEAIGLALIGVTHLPLLPVMPFFYGTLFWHLLRYHRLHKRAHLDPQWAREHLPWHYDHHMGPDQDQNWCVTRPWFDHLMKTRVPYVGTEKEAADQSREAERVRRKKVTAA